MSIGLAVLLGIVQGLTEFFPVSSSGHLALFGYWFGMHEPDITFDILVHLATLGAIVVYFRHDWWTLLRTFFSREKGDFPNLILPFLLLSMVPAGVVGVLFKDSVTWMHGKPALVGLCLLLTGVTLLFGMRFRERGFPLKEMGIGVVLVMACAQALAVLPGISRSGATIMAAVFLGMERKDAARFSFLMAVPVIGGAGLLTVIDLVKSADTLDPGLWPAYGAGFVAAAISGFFALAFLMRLLQGNRFFLFGFYCLAVGLAAIFF